MSKLRNNIATGAGIAIGILGYGAFAELSGRNHERLGILPNCPTDMAPNQALQPIPNDELKRTIGGRALVCRIDNRAWRIVATR